MDDFENPIPVFPHSPTAEASLIGSVLIRPDAIKGVSIQPEDFYVLSHRQIWAVMQELAREGSTPEYVSICSRLQGKGQLAEIGGAAKITQLAGSVVSTIYTEQYAEIILAMSRRRKLIQAASDLVQSAYNLQSDVDGAVSLAMDALSKSVVQGRGARHISEFLSGIYDEAEKAAESPTDIFGISTGFKDWDRLTGGLQKGEVLKLSGEPGLGKSLLAFAVLANAAKAGHAGALYELEMDCAQVVRRQVSAESRVPTRKIRSGRMGDDDWPVFIRAIEDLSTRPIYMAGDSHMTTADIRADIHRLQDSYGVELVVIDYEGLLCDEGGRDDNERGKMISSRVHSLVKDLNVAAIVIDDMNKIGISGQAGKAGLAGSARKLHDADQIVIMRKDEKEPTKIKLQWEKNREGASDMSMFLVKLPDLPAFGDYRKLP